MFTDGHIISPSPSILQRHHTSHINTSFAVSSGTLILSISLHKAQACKLPSLPVGDSKEYLNANNLKNSRETPVNCPIGIRKDFSERISWSMAQLKCLYSSVRSMGNKEEDLEATVQLENYDLMW